MEAANPAGQAGKRDAGMEGHHHVSWGQISYRPKHGKGESRTAGENTEGSVGLVMVCAL